MPEGSGARRMASEQFLSRIGPRLVIDEIDPADVDCIVAARGIRNEAAMGFLRRVARGDGHLRSVEKVINLAAHLTKGRPPLLSELEQAAGMCGRRP